MKTPLLSISRDDNGEYWLILNPKVGIQALVNMGLCDQSNRFKDKAVVAVYSEQAKQKPMPSLEEISDLLQDTWYGRTGHGGSWQVVSQRIRDLFANTAESEELKRQLQQSQAAVKSLREDVEELNEVKRQLRESKATVELLENLVADLRRKEEQAIKDQAQTIAIARQLEVDVARYRSLPRYRGCSDRMCGASDCPTCFPVSSRHEGMEAEPE